MNVDLRIPVTPDQKAIITEAAGLDQMDMAAWARPILVRMAEARIAKRKRGEARPGSADRAT